MVMENSADLFSLRRADFLKTLETSMTKRAFGLFLSITGACALGAGCSSSSNNGGLGGITGTGGHAGAGGAGTGGAGGAGTGGVAGSGAGGRIDAGTDLAADTGPGTDARADTGTDARADAAVDAPAVDAPADAPTDALAPATFTQVFNQILNNTTMPDPATSPGCANCHDGMPVDGGSAGQVIAHSISYLDKAAAYTALVGAALPAVGVDSLRCPAGDGGPAVKRVLPGNPDESVLVQKLRQGLGIGTACDKVQMPLNIPLPGDGGGADSGFTQHQITPAELDLVVRWVTAGAMND
jgi:hypothetical protein